MSFSGVAEALAEAHRQGVLHRDIKPSNLLLDQEGRLRIVDFGLALHEKHERLTTTGAMVGTPAYMSPEQVRGELATAASDIYSLGITLYELLTLRTPFEGPSRGGCAPSYRRGESDSDQEAQPGDSARSRDDC